MVVCCIESKGVSADTDSIDAGNATSEAPSLSAECRLPWRCVRTNLRADIKMRIRIVKAKLVFTRPIERYGKKKIVPVSRRHAGMPKRKADGKTRARADSSPMHPPTRPPGLPL